MTTRQFIEKQFGNADGLEKICSSVFKDGEGNIYSYGYHYPLLFKVDGLTFRNVRGYSHTTSKHICWTYGIEAINVELEGDDRLRSLTLETLKKRLTEQTFDLLRQITEKKRTDTWVYQNLQRQYSVVSNSLNKIEQEQYALHA